MSSEDRNFRLSAEEVESISLVVDLCQQKTFEQTVEVVLEKLPESFKDVKLYFTHFMEYVKLTNTFFKIRDENLRKILKHSLGKIQKNIESAIRNSEPPIKEFLQLHYMMNAQFKDDGDLSFKEERTVEKQEKDNKKAEKIYHFLIRNKFVPAHFVAAKIYKSWEEQMDVLKRGVNRNDPSASILLANNYLNAVLVMDKVRMEFLKDSFQDPSQALKVIIKGIQRKNPTAITYATSIVDRFLAAVPHLYMPEEEGNLKDMLRQIGKNAAKLCEALELLELRNQINKMMVLDRQKGHDVKRDHGVRNRDVKDVKMGNEPKQIAKTMSKEAQVGLKKEFEKRTHDFKVEAFRHLPKFIKFKHNVDDAIEELNKYIQNAEKRSAMAWKYSLYQKGRLKNIQFAKDLRNELYRAEFQVLPEKLPESITKLRDKFETQTSSEELNKALDHGFHQLYPKIKNRP